MRLFRLFVVSTAVSVAVLGGYHFLSGAHVAVASNGLDLPGFGADFTTNYSLSRLSILERTIHRVDVQYVDPERVDYDAMFSGALSAVEKLVPEVLLRMEDQRLHVQVDDYTTVLQVRKLDSGDALSAELKRVAQILEDHLRGDEIPFDEVEYALANGMLSTLDPHTVLMPPENARKMEEDNEGQFGGLGISIKVHEGQLMIEYPMEGTPAWKAKLQPRDVIVAIDGEGTINMNIDDAVEKMRGEAGTSVTLSIMREGFTTPRDYSIVRDVIKTGRVYGEMLDGNVGYVRIDSFHSQVETQLEEELAALGRKAGPGGLKGLVLDMRDNPGGYLNQAVAVADTFLQKGVIVSTVGREGADREEKSARGSGTEPNYPMVVLMSGSSASAAEIVAGALKNNERAVIVGENSFGKGSVQELYPMDNQSRLKLTVARYLTPGDRSIQMIGIPPDIELVRTYVAPPRELKELGTMSGPRIALFSRDHLLREADLQGHLVNHADEEVRPVYSLRYLAKDSADEVRVSDRKDVRSDTEVMLARDVLLAARGARRADVLRDAAAVVGSRTKTENSAIEAAFAAQQIDWTDCANPASADVELRLSFTGPDGGPRPELRAGELTTATLEARNTGAQPLCRSLVRLESEKGNDVLDGVEFYLGKLAPGGSRSFTTKVLVPQGYPTEEARVDLQLLDSSRRTLLREERVVRTTGLKLPRYAWSWKVDDQAGGDGDGVVEVGETVRLQVELRNVGEGDGGKANVSLRKDVKVGRAVELSKGIFDVPALAVGASAGVDLELKVKELPTDGAIPVELTVRDESRYDYASVMKAEFYNYYAQTEKLSIPVGSAAPTGSREPPAIQITREPGGAVSGATVTVSGVATDDHGVRDVIVYLGENKIAYAGGGTDQSPVKSVPFSASARLADGNNLVVVLVRDTDGLTATHTVDVLASPPVASTEGRPPNP